MATLLGVSRPWTASLCTAAAVLSALITFLLMLVLGHEGQVCLLMAAPLALPFAAIGALHGRAVVGDRWDPARFKATLPLLLALLPALAAAEGATVPPSSVFTVTTSVVVRAAPETVWQHVVTFPPLGAPDELLFRAGIAYPIAATIDGEGVGALRKCTFNTGSFLEPIQVWDPPRVLGFSVVESPQPMIEWNPFHDHVDAPHLHGFFQARRGEFRLVPLPDGTTRLEGTTWYSHGLWPEGYWRLWSDGMVHGIHTRVLEHVKALSEGAR